MRLSLITVAVLLCVMTIGCQEDVQTEPSHKVNSRIIKSYNDIAIQNAIVSQHTLFPYHFVTNAAELNELGQRDLSALISHFVKHPGKLNVRRHNATAALYDARVNMVRERLVEAGVEVNRINISDDMPGGEGILSEKVMVILQQQPRRTSSGSSSSIGAGIK